MKLSSSEASSYAIASLQDLLSEHVPGSIPYSITERALDLVCNGTSSTQAASEQNLLVEAARILTFQVRANLLVAHSQPQIGALRKAALKSKVPISGSLQRELFARKVQAELPRLFEQAGAVKVRGHGHAYLC